MEKEDEVKTEECKAEEVKAVKPKKSAYQRLVDKIIKAKEKKFGLKYNSTSEEYASYCLYTSGTIDSYQQYKHYSSFYGSKILSKVELFKWYKMFFEVRTDCLFAQETAPTKEGFIKNLPIESSKWTKGELRQLKKYVEDEVLSREEYFKLYKVKFPKATK